MPTFVFLTSSFNHVALRSVSFLYLSVDLLMLLFVSCTAGRLNILSRRPPHGSFNSDHFTEWFCKQETAVQSFYSALPYSLWSVGLSLVGSKVRLTELLIL